MFQITTKRLSFLIVLLMACASTAMAATIKGRCILSGGGATDYSNSTITLSASMVPSLAFWAAVALSLLLSGVLLYSYRRRAVIPTAIVLCIVVLSSFLTADLRSTQTTDADGNYTFSSVMVGNYKITGEHTGYTSDSVDPVLVVSDTESVKAELMILYAASPTPTNTYTPTPTSTPTPDFTIDDTQPEVPGQNYHTFSGLISYLNTNWPTDSITIAVSNGPYNEAVNLNGFGWTSASKTVTFEAQGNVTINGGAAAAIEYNGVSYVRMTGFNLESSDNVVWVHNDAQYNSLENCTIASIADGKIGVLGEDGGTSSDDDFTIDNCTFGPTFGTTDMSSRAIKTTGDVSNWVVSNSSFTCTSGGGEAGNFRAFIETGAGDSMSIYDNTFITSTWMSAIEDRRGNDTTGPFTNIYRNYFQFTHPGMLLDYVIYLDGYGTDFYNNMIYTKLPVGVQVDEKNIRIHFNSMYNPNGGAMCWYFNVTEPNSGTEFTNNVTYAAGTVNSFIIYIMSGDFADIDYNQYYQTAGNLAYDLPDSYVNLAAWQTHIGDEANSHEGDPVFVDVSEGSPDLHIQVTSPCRGFGQAVTGISDDYDGDSRPEPVGSDPDIGADERN